MSTKIYEAITPGSLIRVEFQQPLRGLTISAFEVAVLNVTREDGDALIVSVKLYPFTKGYGELRFHEPTERWTFCIDKKYRMTEVIPVRKVTLLD